MAMEITDENMSTELERIITNADLAKLSINNVMEQMSMLFGSAIYERKKDIKQKVNELVAAQADAEEEEEEEEAPESSASEQEEIVEEPVGAVPALSVSQHCVGCGCRTASVQC